MSFNNEPSDDEFFKAMSCPPRSKSSNGGGTGNESFTVYNPVEDSFEGWPHGTFEDALSANEGGDSFRDNNRGSHIDSAGDGPSSPARSDHVDNENEDDELARAIAEQNLPPGVSAVEQQEIMMRLLTQQLRRGDESGEGVSPELEQRLRE